MGGLNEKRISSLLVLRLRLTRLLNRDFLLTLYPINKNMFYTLISDMSSVEKDRGYRCVRREIDNLKWKSEEIYSLIVYG